MKGRWWLVVGAVVGIAVGIGNFPYLAGAASSFSDTVQHVVGTGALTLIHSATRAGAPRRAIEGLQVVLAVLVPGATALLLVVAARSSLRVRQVISILLVVLGAVAFVYLPYGPALGVALLALAIAGLAVAATGPLVAAPLVAVAALIGTEFLPRIISDPRTLPNAPVSTLHQALFGTAGSPLWLEVVVLAVAALPFAVAARLVLPN